MENEKSTIPNIPNILNNLQSEVLVRSFSQKMGGKGINSNQYGIQSLKSADHPSRLTRDSLTVDGFLAHGYRVNNRHHCRINGTAFTIPSLTRTTTPTD